jgi:hypothetical protein
MQGAEVRAIQPVHQGEIDRTNVEMENVELIQLSDNMVKLNHIVDRRIAFVASRSKRCRHTGTEVRTGGGITTGEQNHLMAPAHKFFGEVMNNPFGSSIPSRRNTFKKRGNLSYSHLWIPYSVFSHFKDSWRHRLTLPSLMLSAHLLI